MTNTKSYTDAEREHIEELSASYVLGSLTEDAEGLKEFETLIESGDPLLSKTLEQMLGASVTLAAAVPQFEPPASIRASLLERAGQATQVPGGTDGIPVIDKGPALSQDAVRLKTRTRYFIGTSILSGLLLCILVAMNVSKSAKLDRSNDLMKALLKQTDSLRQAAEPEVAGRQNDSLSQTALATLKDNPDLSRFFAMFGEPDSRLVTMASAPLGTSRQHLFFSPKQKTVALLRENLKALDAGKTYELWATVGNKAPVAIGTFRIDPKTSPAILSFTTKLKNADSFAISIEPGSGGNVRKGAVIFTGDVPKSGIN